MPTIAELGDVEQLAFVPSDFERTLRYWTEGIGAGPFHILTGSRAEFAYHRGVETGPELTIALGYWDDLQIEIIRQDNEAPSLYREWRDSGREGVHHVCVCSDDLEAAARIVEARGGEVIFRSGTFGTEWFYADLGGDGPIVEVLRHSEGSRALLRMIRDSRRGWDGSDPVRYL